MFFRGSLEFGMERMRVSKVHRINICSYRRSRTGKSKGSAFRLFQNI